jgi:hypothetical protein
MVNSCGYVTWQAQLHSSLPGDIRGSSARTRARRLTPRRSSGTGDMTPKGLLRHNEYEDVLRREHGTTGVHRSRVTWWPPSDGSAQTWTDLMASE